MGEILEDIKRFGGDKLRWAVIQNLAVMLGLTETDVMDPSTIKWPG